MSARPTSDSGPGSRARVEIDDAGHLRVAGELTFDSARAAWEQGLRCIQGRERVIIDLGQVRHSDSSGLALVLEWLRAAKRTNATVSVCNAPEQMLAIAGVSRLEGLLLGGPTS